MTNGKLTLSQQKRQAIQEAASSLFREHGVKDTSMDKIAQVAQVSKRTVYNHFATKEALVMHLVSELWSDAVNNTALNYCDTTPLAEQLETLLMMELKIMASEQYIDLVRVALGCFLFEPQALQQELQKMKILESDLERWLKAALLDNKLKPLDVDIALEQLHSLVKGSCFWPPLMRLTPVLTQPEQQALVTRSVEMFLSQYQA